MKHTNGWKKTLKEFSTTVFIKEMQIRTALRFHLTPFRLSWSIKQMTAHDGVYTNTAIMEIGVVFLLGSWWSIYVNPIISLLGIYSKVSIVMCSYLCALLLYSSQSEGRNRLNVYQLMHRQKKLVHLQNGILFIH